MSRRAWLIAVVIGVAVTGGPLAFNPDLARLDLVLMKLGALAFGGGFTLIPLIQREVVEQWGWLTTREFIDAVALGQVTPGPIVITATFVGYRVGGLVGAAMSTVAVFLPSFLVLLAVLPRYDRIKRYPVVQSMIHGVLAAFVALLVFLLVQFGRTSLVDWKTAAIAAGAMIALWRNVDLLVIVGAAAAASMLLP
jgi:chromate transporter